VFSNGGSTGKYVEDNNIGLNITIENMSEKLNQAVEMYRKNENSIHDRDRIKMESFNTKRLVTKVEKFLV